MRVYIEFLFWFHLLLILAVVLIGYFLPPLFVFIFIIVHEIHVKIFHGCILTNYEKYLHGLPKSADFFQYAVKRLTGINADKFTARVINYSILLLCLLLSVYRFGFK